MDKKRFQLVVSGKVQGVWFRRSTQQKAKELNVTGFVKNQEDGTVFMEIEGDAPQIEKLIQWCHHGPKYAQVTNVSVTSKEKVGSGTFEIK